MSAACRLVATRIAIACLVIVGGPSACAVPAEPPDVLASTAPAWATAGEVVLQIDLERRTAAVVRTGHALGAGQASLDVVAGAVDVTDVGVDAPPGMRRVRLVLGVAPSRAGARLGQSSRVPQPPGQRGALVIPHAAEVVADSGRVDVTAGTTLTVVLPSAGRVVPGPDFDGDGSPGAGSPFAFFADARCHETRVDGACLRYETLPAERESRRLVGFDVEPRVRRFRARLLVAGDVVGN